MKLCYFASLESVHSKRWVRYFADQGHTVHVVSPSPHLHHLRSSTDSYNEEGTTVHRFRVIRKGLGLWGIFLNLIVLLPRVLWFRALMRRIRPDLVHAHYVNEVALFALLTGCRPYVVTAWGDDILIDPKRSWIRRQGVQFIIKRADLITCDAQHMKDELIRLGAEPSKIQIINFGTDVETFRPEKRDINLRQKLGIEGSPSIISLRNLLPEYDLISLIKAIPTVLEKAPSATFLIAGSGSESITLGELSKDLGIAHNVQFIGRISEPDLALYLASSDIYVSTALSDAGLSASTAEAMACGLPVVITDVADNREWVQDGVSGFLVPPSDPKAVASRIIYLIEHQQDGKKMGLHGRHTIVERNNRTTEMAKMNDAYHQLTYGSGHGSSINDSDQNPNHL